MGAAADDLNTRAAGFDRRRDTDFDALAAIFKPPATNSPAPKGSGAAIHGSGARPFVAAVWPARFRPAPVNVLSDTQRGRKARLEPAC